VGEHAGAEAAQQLGHAQPDRAQPDQPDGGGPQLQPGALVTEAGGVPPAGREVRGGGGQAAHRADHRAHAELGDRAQVAARQVRDEHAGRGGRGQVDVHRPAPGHPDHPQGGRARPEDLGRERGEVGDQRVGAPHQLGEPGRVARRLPHAVHGAERLGGPRGVDPPELALDARVGERASEQVRGDELVARAHHDAHRSRSPDSGSNTCTRSGTAAIVTGSPARSWCPGSTWATSLVSTPGSSTVASPNSSRSSNTRTVPSRPGPSVGWQSCGRSPTTTSLPSGTRTAVASPPTPPTRTPLPVPTPGSSVIDGSPTKSATNVSAGASKISSGVPNCLITPASITAIRSARLSASSWSWVTTIVV